MKPEEAGLDKPQLLKQVNASGFPFQERIRHEIESSQREHGWRVLAPEHRWALRDSPGEEGFIDLVLGKSVFPERMLYMVIECKRTRGGSWVFLHPAGDPTDRNDVSTLCVRHESDTVIRRFWKRTWCDPESPISSFCAVPGQGNKATPMLERVASDLLLSVEGLSHEVTDLTTANALSYPALSTYVPVLVTNTPLVVCRFDPTRVGLASGLLEDGEADLAAVPLARFRKSLSTTLPPENADPVDLRNANETSQRTILVVHASHLREFLRLWSFR